jgi:autotransporter-associated beta strand protein
MSNNARARRWTGWTSRKPSVLRPFPSLGCEQLEDRLAPATFTWTGGSTGTGANANWSNPANWQGGVAPSTGVIDLVFPAGASRLNNFNDLAAGTVINSITFQGSGYNISESPDPAANSIVLGNGSPSSGNFTVQAGLPAVTFSLPTTLATNGDQSFLVGLGSALTVTTPISGSLLNNLNKDGVGRLVLGAANPNLLGGVKVNNGILEVRNAQSLGPAGGTETVVSPGAGLYLSNIAGGAVGEQLRLNGGGVNITEGALYNLSGNTTWSGPIILETGIISPPQAGGPGTVIGAAVGTTLDLTGVVSDSGAGMGLVKEGAGEVRLGSQTGNTYRGQTNINNGVLTATHPLSLGDSRSTSIVNGLPPNDPRARPQPGNFGTISGAYQSLTFGTVVNVAPGRSGQLRLEAPTNSPGFTIVGEFLVLNGSGPGGAATGGAFASTRGDNTWAGGVILGSAAPDGVAPTIGVAPATTPVPSSLAISGQVDDPNLPGATLTKVGGGRLILTNSNLYTGLTRVTAGTVTARDSRALGPAAGGAAGGTEVSNGAAVELDVEAAYAESVAPRYDDLGRDTWADSTTTDPQRLRLDETLTLTGRGIGAAALGSGVTPNLSTGGTGALRSVTGINSWIAPITIVPIPNNADGEAAVGVEPDGPLPDGNPRLGVNGKAISRAGHPTPDSTYFTADYSLTIVSTVSGSRGMDFVKRGGGQLILPNANPYFGRTLIEQGWVTVQNNRSLGDAVPATNFGEYSQQPTIVSNGAAIHIRPPAFGVQINLQEDNIVLEGIGPTHPYSFISQKGALVNLGGANTVEGDIGLVNTHSKTIATVVLPAPATFLDVTFAAVIPGGLLPSDVKSVVGPGGAVQLDPLRPPALLSGNAYRIFIGNGVTPVPAGQYTVTFDVSEARNIQVSPVAGSLPAQGAGIGVEDIDAAALGESRLTIIGDLSDGIRYQQSFSGTSGVTETARVYDAGVTTGRITVPYVLRPIGDRLRIYYPPRNQGGTLVYDSGPAFNTGDNRVTPGMATFNFSGASTLFEVVMDEGGGFAGPTNYPLPNLQPFTENWQVGVATIAGTPRGIVTQYAGSLVKLGSKTLALQGAGSQTGARNEVREGTLLLQNDTALGRATDGTETTQQIFSVTQTEVATGATLQLAGSVARHEGGVAAGVNVQDERLVLNEYGLQIRVTGQGIARYRLNFAGQQTDILEVPATDPFRNYAQYLQDAINTKLTNIANLLVAGVPGATPADAQATVVQTGPGVYTVTFGAARFNNFDFSALTADVIPIGNAPNQILAGVRFSGSNAPLIGLSDDNTWRGPVTLNRGTRIEVRPNSRLTLLGSVTDDTNPGANGSDLVKRDAGDLTLGGSASNYRGTTYLDEGIVTAISSLAFGSPLNGTAVANGAQLQLQGSLTIAGEALQVEGNGTPTLPSLDSTIRWLSVATGATNNGVAPPYTPTGAPTSAQINSIATDPTDPRVIYVATAGGGAWKTKDGGLTWIALFDLGVETSTDDQLDPPVGPTAGSRLPIAAMMFGGQIAVAPSNPAVVYYATGDANGQFSGIPNVAQTDNFAGSGVYRSTDSGKTWELLTANDGSNPMYGQAVTKMIVDPFNADRLYVATSTLRLTPAVSLQTPSTLLNVNPFTPATAPRAGVWRYTAPSPPPADPNAPPPELIKWVNLTGTASPNRSATGGTVGQAPFDAAPNGNGPPGNITIGGVSGGAGPDDDYRLRFPAGTAGTNEAATWSDIALVVRTTQHPVYGSLPGYQTGAAYTLYAALGESFQRYYAQGTTGTPIPVLSFGVFNGVYRTDNPDYISGFSTGPTWWSGTGTREPLLPADAALPNPDTRGTAFPVGPLTDPASGLVAGRNGYIKLTATTVADERGPYIITRDGANRITGVALSQPGGAAYAAVTVYAATLWREGGSKFPPNTGDTYINRGDLMEIQRSTNRGWTWATLANIPTQPFGVPVIQGGVNVRPALGRYDFVLQVADYDPRTNADNNGNEVFLGGLDFVYRTGDGGATAWQPLAADARGFAPPDQVHALTFDSSGRLLIGTDGGLWRWDRVTFSNLNSGLPVQQLNSADAHPTDFRQAVAGEADNGTQRWVGNTSDGSTGGWQRVDDASTSPATGTSGSVSGVVRYDPQNPLVIYAVRDGQLRKSADGGATWVQINPAAAEFGTTGFTGGNGGPFPARFQFNTPNAQSLALLAYDKFPLVVDPLTANRVVIGGRTFNPNPLVDGPVTRLYESTDGGNSWTNLNTAGLDALTAPTAFVPTVIALAGYQGAFVPDTRFPTVTEGLSNTPDPRTIYASNGAVIAVTKNRGVSWRNATGNLTVPAGGTITDVVVNPVNRDEVYAVVSAAPGVAGARVWRSTDAGQTWTNLTGAYDPDATAGDPDGTSTDQGPLPNIPIWKVTVDPRTGALYVGTDNGVWQLVDPNADQTNLARTANPALPPGYPPATLPASPTGMYWRRVGDGMPNVPVHDLVLNQTTNTLTAATYGRGMFQMFLPDYAANSGAVRAVSGSSRWTGPVTLTGNTRVGAVGTQQIQNGLSAASVDFGGTISSPGGAFTLEKVGRGTLILSGANTYTGQTVVREGVVEVKDPNALGAATGNTEVMYGAALQVRSDIEAEPITVNGDGIFFNGRATGALRNISGNNVYNGVLTLGTGVAAPPDPLDRSTTQVTIGVDSGTSLRIGKNPNSPNPLLVGRVQGATAAMGFDKELPGTLILSGDNTAYMGLTQVYAGAVEVRNGLALGPAGSQPTRVTDGAALRIANDTPGDETVVDFESLFLSGTGIPDGAGGAGSGALRNTGGNNAWNGPIRFTSIPATAPTTNPGTQIAIGVTNAADVLTVGPAAGITEDSAVAQYGLIKVGAGVLRLTTANQYAGVTNVNEGTVRVADNGALGANTVSSEVQTIRVFGTGNFRLNLNGQETPVPLPAGPLAAGATAAAVAEALERLISGGVANPGSESQPNVLVTETPNANGRVYTVTFRGRFAGQDMPLILVVGASAGVTVTVDAPQQGGRGTVVAGGASLELDGSGLNVAEELTINGQGVTEGAAPVVRYGALGNRGGDNTYSGRVTFGSATSMGAQPGTTLTVTGAVFGQPNDPVATPNPTTAAAAELTKVGTGTVVFPNDKAYRGRTEVAEGVLRIQSAGALGAGRSEVQRVRVTGTFGATKYTLTFLGETTDPITLAASDAGGAAALLAALTSPRAGGTLPAMFAPGDLTITPVVIPGRAAGDSSDEAVFDITFTGNLANTNVPLLTDVSPSTTLSLATTPLTEGQPANPIGANEVQAIVVPNQAGTFTLNGFVGTFDFDLSLAAFQAALDLEYGAGNTVATVATQPGNAGRVFRVTFQGTLANTNVALITGTFTPTASVRTQTLQDGVGSEVQLVDVQGTNGRYSLRYTDPVTGQEVSGTRLLLFNASAADFQSALTDPVAAGGLGLGAGNVRVTRSSTLGGFQYLVQFTGALANVNLLAVQVVPVSGEGVTSSTATLQDGPEGTVVRAGAALEVLNLGALNTMSTERVTLFGDGIGGTGALRMRHNAPSSTIVWDAPIILGATATIGVDDPADVLRLTRAITDRDPLSPVAVPPAVPEVGPTGVRGTNQTFGVNKVGAGTLEYAATGDNDYLGTTTVKDGTLLLNHTGTSATPTGGSVRGPLVVGDDEAAVTPGAQTAVVRLAQSNQIADAPVVPAGALAAVVVNADGRLDLGGFADTIGTLRVQNGVVTTNNGGTGGSLTAGAVTIVGSSANADDGRVTVRDGGTLTAGALDMTDGALQVGTTAAATATFSTITARATAAITTAAGATLSTVNGAVRGTVSLTDSSLTTGTGSHTLTGLLTLTGTTAFPASTVAVGDGADLNTGGQNVAINNSRLTTGAGATLSTVGASARGTVTLTDSNLAAGDNSQTLTGAVSLTTSTLTLGNGASTVLDTGSQSVTLDRSALATGTGGVQVNPTAPAGNLTVTGPASSGAPTEVNLGAGTVANFGTVGLTQADLATGTSSVLTTGAVTLAQGSTLTTGNSAAFTGASLTATGSSAAATGVSSTTNLGAVTLTDSSLVTGAGSTATLTGPLSATGTNGGIGVGVAGTLSAQAVSLAGSNLAVAPTGAASLTDLSLTDGHVVLAAGGTATTTGTVSVLFPTAATPASDVTGLGTFRLSGTGNRTVSVADGTPVVDFEISSGLTALAAQNLVKTGAGRLRLTTPAGNFLPTAVVAQDGDVQVDGTTAAVQLDRQTGTNPTLSGTGTVGAVSGLTGAPAAAAGTVSPGDNASSNPYGVLTSTGDVTWGPGTTFFLNLTGNNTVAPVAGVHYDQLVTTGNVSLGGAKLDGLVVQDVGTTADDFIINARFTILRTTAGTITGAFADNGSGVVFINGYKFQIDYSIPGQVDLVKVPAVTTTTLTSSTGVNPSTLNQPVTFTATVTSPEVGAGPLPAGTTVTFFVDGVAVATNVPISAGGVATFTTSTLAGGTHTVQAEYNGDAANFGASTSTDLTQVVEVPAVTLQTVSPTPVAISPNNSPGTNDALQLTALTTQERAAYTYVVVVRDALNNEVFRSAPRNDQTATGVNTSTIAAVWDGKDNGGNFVADGVYTVYVQITDVYGNTPRTADATVTVDNTSPTGTGAVGAPVILPGNATPPPPAQSVFTGTVADANLAGWTVTVRDANGNTVNTFTGSTGVVSAAWNGTTAGGAVVPDGTYTLTLVATDLAGNTSTPVTRTVVVLSVAPTITLTSGLGAAAGPTTYGDAVTLTATLSLPAAVAAAANPLLVGIPVTFTFPGVATPLTANVALVGGSYVASVVVPLNLGAGSYTSIQASFGTTANFLGATSAAVTHVVNPAQLRVSASNATRTYGDANPAFTYAVTAADLKFSDTAAVVTGTPGTTATAASPVGAYPIGQGTVGAGPNYTVVFTAGTLTITQVPLTIRVNDATRARFGQNPAFTATFEGFKLSDGPSVVGNLNLVTTATPNSPVGTYPITAQGTPTAQNYAITVVPGTLTVNGSPTATVVGSGGAPAVAQVLAPDGSVQTTIPLDPSFAGGIRTASADFNKDGVADFVMATGPGALVFVQVVDGATGQTLFQANPFEGFTGGAFVAAGDITGDGVAELVITPDEGGGPRVVIFRGGDFAPLVSYFAIDDPAFRGGVRPAVGDINGDGFADLAVSAGFGGGPRVSLWDGQRLSKLEFVNMTSDFFVFEDSLRNGAFVAIGDVDGDGFGDLVAGAGPGGGPRVKVISGRSLLSDGVAFAAANPFANFFGGNVENRGGVKVTAKNLDGDRFADVVTGGGLGDRAVATAYRGSALAQGRTEVMYDIDLDGTLNGVFVG